MSGHSKWSTIKRAKGKMDAARANVFTKLGREIAVAVRAGGPDPNTNSKLKDIIAKARSKNMPNDNITRSIKKAAGDNDGANYENIVYEGYGAGGVAVILETLTDNKNRTAADVRHIFDKNGGSLGTTNCVSYMFESKGIISIAKQVNEDEDEIMMLSLELGALDFETDESEYYITTKPSDIDAVRNALEQNGRTILSCSLEREPTSSIKIDEDNLKKVQKMLDMFEDNDDIQNVYHNAEINQQEE